MTFKVTGVALTLKHIKTRSEEEIENQKSDVMDTLVDNLKLATPVDTGRARDGWYRDHDSIDNDVEYIDKLNGGSSKQAPEHFVERTILSHPGVSPSGIIVESK
jgi:hypothetical protein